MEFKIKNQTVLVDDADWFEVKKYTWHLTTNSKTYYVRTWVFVGQKRIGLKLHQLLIPSCPEGYVRDHKDRNGLNNQRDNLRIVTPSLNSLNRSTTKNKLLPKGITKEHGKFRVKCQHKSLGCYTHLEQAVSVYNKYYDNVTNE